MDVELSDEHEAFRASVRAFLAERSPTVEVRRVMETATGHDPAVWGRLADQLGLQGLIIPEEHGGSGFGAVELGVALEETGRALLCAPLLGTVLGTLAILASGDEQAAKRHLPPIAAGETVAALALADDSAHWPPAATGLTARRSGDGHVLDGHRAYVVDGLLASLVVVLAAAEDGPALFVVDGDAGVRRTTQPTTDRTRRLARLEFRDTPARRLCGAEVLSSVLDQAAVALAAEQVGGARRCLEIALAHVSERRQFGRPIGSFQTVKHRLADMLFDVEGATSAVRYATACAAAGSGELTVVAPLTRAHCSEVYTRAAGTMLQLHGGIGFTWEHDAHLYLKRAKSSELLLGDPAHHRELLAVRAGF